VHRLWPRKTGDVLLARFWLDPAPPDIRGRKREGQMDSLEYRKAALNMVQLAALDAELGHCQSSLAEIARSLAERRDQLDEMSARLASRPDNVSPARAEGGRVLIRDAASREGETYRRLVEEYVDSSRVARSRTRVLESEQRVLELRRKRLEREIPAGLLNLYDALARVGRKPAVTALAAGLCSACRALVGPELQAQIEGLEGQSGPLRCPRCERLLFLASWERQA
jgi:predicted  nucleic acid-binding Zn-ribbon protein